VDQRWRVGNRGRGMLNAAHHAAGANDCADVALS